MSLNGSRSIGLCVLCVLAMLSALVIGADKSKPKRQLRFEYCSIAVLTIEDESRVVFIDSSDQTTKARDMVELATKMKIPGEGSQTRILNYLGSQGWRLSFVDHIRDANGSVHTYIFERQAP